MFVRSRIVVPRKRKKGSYRLFATTAFMMSTALVGRSGAAAPQNQAPVVRPVDAIAVEIPAGQLDAVLKALALATGFTFDTQIPTDTLGMMYSPGVSGRLQPEEAIAAEILTIIRQLLKPSAEERMPEAAHHE